MSRSLGYRIVTLRNVPSHIVALTALASYAGQIVATFQGWPLWAFILATVAPWVPVFSVEMIWTRRHYHWMVLLYVLVVTQTGRFAEHLIQFVQLHILNYPVESAVGVLGILNSETANLFWNARSILLIGLTLYGYRRDVWARNPWLWLALAVVAWHEIEYAYLAAVYFSTGEAGGPGLLAEGGAIAGGLPVTRADLHFFYALIEIVLFVLALGYQLTRSYDAWLAKAFPRTAVPVLAEMTSFAEPMRFPSGRTVVRQGDLADVFYIIARGQASVTHRDPSGREVELATLGPGEFFGEIGLLHRTPRTATVRAKTNLEVLALGSEALRSIMKSSTATAEDLSRMADRRLAEMRASAHGESDGATTIINRFDVQGRATQTQYEYAALLWRGIAVTIDSIILAVPAVLIAWLGGSIVPGGWVLLAVLVLLVLGLSVPYGAILETAGGATLGKRALSMRVVKTDGSPLDRRAALLRNLWRLVDGLAFYLVGGVAILRSHRHQRLGDRAAGTVVVRRAA